MTGNTRTEAALIVAGAALAGAGLGLAVASAAVFAAIALGWPAVDEILYLGVVGGTIIGGIACYHSDRSRRLRLQCTLAAASIGAFAGMIVVFGGGNAFMLLEHERTTFDRAFEITLAMVPFAMIVGGMGGAALGPRAERRMTAWSYAIIDRLGYRRPD